MKKKFTFILALTAVLCACVSFAACGIFEGSGGHKETAPTDIILGEITDSSIEVKDCVFDDEYAHFPQLSLDGKNWTERLSLGGGCDGYLFEGLEPNTEYTVYAREGSRGGNYKPSDAITKTATTLRTAASGVPEGVDYEQNHGKITLTNFSDEMEASFDGGKTYGGGEHTFTVKGEYTVLVRYKQTDKAFASESAELKVEYSDFTGGLGTEQKPYLIGSYAELCKMKISYVTCFKLINDIVFPAEAVGSVPIAGRLDGNGKKIISPKIDTALNKNGETSLFCFANLSIGSAISDLTVENITYLSNKRASAADEGLLTDNAREVINCSVTGEMIINGAGSASFGGIAGCVDYVGKITGCSADVKFTVADGVTAVNNYYFGGIAGGCDSGSAKITGCTAKVSFNLTAGNNYAAVAGGIVGKAASGTQISACSAKVSFSAWGANKAELGGIAGKASGSAKIVNCFAGGEITASGNPDFTDGYGKPAK
ncbi:MAG: hypothetical protein K2N22_01715, partial [Clostridia bacterium]|nr:hypothetical protein [Clostridia bacterium]